VLSPDAVNPERAQTGSSTTPLCWLHHRVYDAGRLELLPHLEPHWRAEVAHAVLHVGLIGTLRRLGRRDS
jgi:hypothetical protein